MGQLDFELRVRIARERRVRPAVPERARGLRRVVAARRAWRDKARVDAALRGSRFKARVVARERFGDGWLARLRPAAVRPFAESRLACLRVRDEVVPFFGGGSLTPARRAFDRPIAIACFALRAPCLPSRMCSISSCTNSPACVDGALPARFAFRARSIVFFSGMIISSVRAARASVDRMFPRSWERGQPHAHGPTKQGCGHSARRPLLLVAGGRADAANCANRNACTAHALPLRLRDASRIVCVG